MKNYICYSLLLKFYSDLSDIAVQYPSYLIPIKSVKDIAFSVYFNHSYIDAIDFSCFLDSLKSSIYNVILFYTSNNLDPR